MVRTAETVDWSFVRRPFWLFSHVFAGTVVISFVLLGLWQLNRHGERVDQNAEIGSRSEPPAVPIAEVLSDGPNQIDQIDQLDQRYVSATGSYLDGEVVRVANRTQGGVAGRHLVGLFELDDGRLLLINRGFVPLDEDSVEIEPAPSGTVTLSGWLQRSAEKGLLGATDTGEGDVVPRLDVAAVESRLGPDSASLAPVWLQLEGDGGTALSVFPDPVPLPNLEAGPHLGYMAQWFIFAVLGTAFYLVLLRRTARGRQRQAPVPEPELAE